MKPAYEQHIINTLNSPDGHGKVTRNSPQEARNAAQGLCVIRRKKGYKITIRQRGNVVFLEG